MDELGVVVLVLLFLFGGLGFGSYQEGIAKRECRMALAKELKLDTANILLICEGK